ncbi:uncharacterized protein BYT42DRAFT_345469 [Radiomyces spectabilis]|uniref:uncharacterized protein n=1 Tax=Radiomyces spectabilis TaxID=64574 RepID=UPI00221FD8CC|nr:uncharacterized protein BYT42DRAFT_345469 [Radiomyces spectabilis]KAI8377466.1 hypothetical protein BYT42DRAFT_345469 [Radiomyces spectabilis]
MSSPDPSKDASTNESKQDAFSALSTSLQGVQSSFSSVYSTLASSLERSVQMTDMVNSMMQQVFKTGVKLASQLEQGPDGTVLLTVTIINGTHFPLMQLSGSIRFDTASKYAETITYDSISTFQITNDTRCESRTLFTLETAEQLCLPAFTKHIERIRIHPPKLMQCNNTISISFATTTDPVTINHAFGLYIIDQRADPLAMNCNLKINQLHKTVDEHAKDVVQDQSPGIEKVYSAAFLRKIMEIQPTLGINKDMQIRLHNQTMGNTFVCVVEAISDDRQELITRFYGNTREDQQLVSTLLYELDILNSN